MRRIAAGFFALLATGAFLWIVPQLRSQPPDGQTPRAALPPRDRTDGDRRPGRGGGRGRFNPFGGGAPAGELTPPEELAFRDGTARIPDHATFHRLAYKGEEVMIDSFLAGLEFVKFTLDQALSEKPQMYYMNTKTHRAHTMFARVVGLPMRGQDQMKGVLIYRPLLKSPSDKAGLYTFEFEPFDTYPYEMVKIAQETLIATMPILKGNLAYYPRGRAFTKYVEEKEIYDNSNVAVALDEDLNSKDVGYLPLNPGATFGRLRLMALNECPTPRDVVIYDALPNELPRVAGIITAVRQTPLSHVNLRAVQDHVPNAFIVNAAKDEQIRSLIGQYVAYKVTADGYELREASTAEVDTHFASLRPTETLTPKRDLSVTYIRALDEITFNDSSNVGVKAANVATMRTFGLPEGTLPDGFAVPFYFYDEFMKHNGFYVYAKELLANPQFQQNPDTQQAELQKLRSLVKKGKMPPWMLVALDVLHKSFPPGTSLRCRSSTNNEDLPGFSGAGLYDSYTQHPDEGHLSKSIKQVFASLWNFRAFEEREFYRVDHFATAMGVLVHSSFRGELANGVAVTEDILYQTEGYYYVNTQIGEDLVTNPEEASVPEELLLDWWDSSTHQVLQTSSRSADGKRLLSPEQLERLRRCLGKIHGKFAPLYGTSPNDERFAMEIEFKITSEGKLAIKQARPWVDAQASLQPQDTSGEVDE